MIVILLPAFNEAVSLPPLFAKIEDTMKNLGADYRIVLCDDGSEDGTAGVAGEYTGRLPLEILVHDLNRGLGETVRDLLEHAARICQPEDIIVRLDCDDTHEPEAIERMLDLLEQGHDVVLASRFQPGGGQIGVSRYRAFVSYFANLLMRAVFRIPNVREYSCGFRAYRAEIIQRAVRTFGNNFIQLKGLGFTGTLEKLVKLHLLGAKFAEIPFVLQYGQKQSSSKMLTSVTSLGYFVVLMMYFWPWGGWRRGYRQRLSGQAPR